MKKNLRWYVNILLVILVFGSWFGVFFFGSGSLVQNGIGSLRYFTMLSNLFAGFTALAWLISAGRNAGDGSDGTTKVGRNTGDGSDGTTKVDLNAGEGPEGTAKAAKATKAGKAGSSGGTTSAGKSENGRASERVERIKYIAAASVGLTCATVLFFLGPIYGYGEMFAGANLPMHLVTPLIAIAEIVFLSDTSYTRRDNLLTIIPPLLFGMGYLANILINGIGEWPNTNDWYFFFYWGYPVGVLIYAVLLAATWLIGLLMRKLQRAGRS